MRRCITVLAVTIPPYAAFFSRVISGVSGISRELSTRSVTGALESFGAGSNSIEED